MCRRFESCRGHQAIAIKGAELRIRRTAASARLELRVTRVEADARIVIYATKIDLLIAFGVRGLAGAELLKNYDDPSSLRRYIPPDERPSVALSSGTVSSCAARRVFYGVQPHH